MSKMLRRLVLALTPFVFLVGVWEVCALAVTALRDVPFPTPLDTARHGFALLSGSPLLGLSIYAHTLHSLLRWVVGFIIAAFSGVAFGVAAGWWSIFERIGMPPVHMIQLVPGLAWIPVAILFFGVGSEATVFMIAVTAFAPVAISVAAGVKRVDSMYLRAALMLGADRRCLFLRVLLPGAMPQILSGLRIGVGNGWRVLVAGEMVVGTGTGLGYSIIQARWTLDYTSAFVCIVVICAIGLLIERAVFAPIERRTVERWGLTRNGSAE